MEPIDLISYHERYSKQLTKAEEIADSITDYDPSDFQDCCYRDDSGTYIHYNSKCPINFWSDDHSGVCPFEQLEGFNDKLRWIEAAPFLSCYFRNPAGARSQNILNGFSVLRFTRHYRYVSVTQTTRSNCH
jgi:hypothetical protein